MNECRKRKMREQTQITTTLTAQDAAAAATAHIHTSGERERERGRLRVTEWVCEWMNVRTRERAALSARARATDEKKERHTQWKKKSPFKPLWFDFSCLVWNCCSLVSLRQFVPVVVFIGHSDLSLSLSDVCLGKTHSV